MVFSSSVRLENLHIKIVARAVEQKSNLNMQGSKSKKDFGEKIIIVINTFPNRKVRAHGGCLGS